MVKCMGEIRIKRDVSDAIVYGFHVDPSISDPSNAVTYLEDAVNMTPASMGSTSFNFGSWADAFFIPKPCMVRFDGTVDYYLDPSDYSKKADGTASDIADPNYAGNAMMEWGLIWFKFEPGEADGEGYFYVSGKKVNDSFNCWCNYDANNNINPHFYTAIYNGTGTDKLRSISGVQLTTANGSGNTTGQQDITRAIANNTSDLTEWYIDLWADRILVTGLLYLMGKSLNLQATFGRGLDSGGYTAKNTYVTGTLNDKGLFWGVTTNGNSALKVFGMENYWGCVWHRTAGLFGTADGYAYKLTHGTVDGSTATEFDTTPSGYIPVSVIQPGTGHVTKMSFGKYGILPTATGGSTSTYYCDYFIKGNGFAMVGGNPNYGLYCGLYIALHQSADMSDWSISTSLSLKPRAKTPYNPDWDNRPAHQVVNGQWVDIPTHHYVNGRWQGELTSQSPLKFRADGEMLDWRIDGKTSGNLWDGTLINTAGWGVSFSVDDDGYMVASSNSDPRAWGYASSQIKMTLGAGTYALLLQGIPPTQSWSGAMIYTSGGSALANNQNLVNKPLIIMPFTLAQETSIGIMVKVVNGKYRVQLLEGTYTTSTIPPYEPYGGVGDWDETAQKYRIPVRVEGENLFDINGNYSAYVYQGSPTCRVDNGQIIVNVVPYYFAHIKFSALIPSGQYTIKCKASANFRAMRLLLTKPFDTGTWNDSYKCYYADMVKNDNYYTYTFTVDEDFAIGFAISGTTGDTGVIDEIMLNEGSTAFPYGGVTTTLYTDHQLMDGDSIDFSTDQTAIPIATGNNTLTVDTAVQPSKVFVKFEG